MWRQFGVQGSHTLNSHNNGQSNGINFDHQAVVNEASGQSGADPSMFASILGKVQGHQSADVDEDEVSNSHDQAYNQGNASNMSAQSQGMAAAMAAFKQFSGSGGSSSSGGSGGTQSLIATAMSMASQLSSGGSSSGSQSDAVESAGKTVMSLLLKSQMSGGGGGASGLLSMAKMFL